MPCISRAIEGIPFGTDRTIVYPDDVPVFSRVEENLYVGSTKDTFDIPSLECAKITHILSLHGLGIFDTVEKRLREHKLVYKADVQEEDLISFFAESEAFIDKALDEGAILVQSFRGVSRAPAVIMAYIMKKQKLTFDQAFSKVKRCHRKTKLNPGFVYQLKLFEKMGYELDKTHMEYRNILLTVTAQYFSMCSNIPFYNQDCIKPNPPQDLAEINSDAYVCRKCQYVLAVEENVLYHRFEHKIDAEYCKVNMFKEPIRWMKMEESKNGPLVCPKCSVEVGCFSWTGSARCKCKTLIKPAIFFTSQKVKKIEKQPIEKD